MRVLVLSGGGSHGAFEAGVVKSLVDQGVRWDAIAGVSVGALNAAVLCQFKKENQTSAALKLKEFWDNVKGNSSVYKRWFPLGKVQGLWKGSLFDTSPLRKLINENIDRTSLGHDVRLLVGAVCLEDGKYVYVDGTNPSIKSWVLASAAFPGAFTPVEIDGKTYVDGGVRDITPISDVLDMKPDQIDIVICGRLGSPSSLMPKKQTKNVLHVGMRCAMLMADEIFNTDLDRLPNGEPPNYRVYSTPPEVTLGDSLEFDPVEIKRLYEVGLLVGKM